MHVLHVSNSLVAGGSELHLLALCRHLRALGVRQTVAYLHERPVSRTLKDEFEAMGIPTVPAHAEGRYNATFPLTVQAIVGTVRPDILHTHLPRADLAGAYVKLRTPMLPWVISMHNIYSAHSWSGAALLPLLDLVWRRADLVIAVSGAVARWLVGRGVDPRRVRMIPYGIDDAAFAPPPGDPKARWGWSGQTVVTAIGRLTPHKGFATLISAWRMVHAHMPDAVLAIAGWDVQGYRQVLEAQIDALGLRDSVRLMGFLDDVPAFLAAGDVFVHPTTSEGFGQVMIEAMAAARPVVCTRIPPLMEIVVEGETGVVVPPDDAEALGAALLRTLTDPAAPAMGVRGRERVRTHYSAASMAERTLRVYTEVLALRPLTPARAASS